MDGYHCVCVCVCVCVHVCTDPTITSSEEKFTALHFCARYLPRVVDSIAQSQEAEEQTQRVNKKSSSWKAINYLISLRGKIEASIV